MSDTPGLDFIIDKLEKLNDKLDQVRVDSTRLGESLKAQEKRDDEVHADVKKISSDLVEQGKLLAEYNEQLRDHIRRTALNEESVAVLKAAVLPIIEKYNEEQTGSKYNSKVLRKRVKMLGAVSVLLSILGALIKLITEN